MMKRIVGYCIGICVIAIDSLLADPLLAQNPIMVLATTHAGTKPITKPSSSKTIKDLAATPTTPTTPTATTSPSLPTVLKRNDKEDSRFLYRTSPNVWLFGDILHPYIGLGLVSSSPTHTHNTQSMSKEVATCPKQANGQLLCSGDTTSAEYAGLLNTGSSIELGAEYFFDKFHILGVRLFGEMTSRSGSLGSKIAGSDTRDTGTNNLQAAYNLCVINNKTWGGTTNETESRKHCGILILGNSTNPQTPNTKVEDTFTFQNTPDSNAESPQDGRYLSFSLGLDAMLNIPIDTILQRLLVFDSGDGFWRSRLMYFKMGIFVGGGAEFARFSQGDLRNKTWYNEAAAKGKASNNSDAFFSAGSGGFMRCGVSIYLSRFTRIDFGYKISYYPIAQERWYGFNGAKFDKSKLDIANGQYGVGDVRENDPWSETLLRQKFVSTKDAEWFVRFALSF